MLNHTELTSEEIIGYFPKIPVDESWTFEDTPRTLTSYVTHSYHRYPAKFIPQLAKRLIANYSTSSDDLICDPFMGCGTTLVEAMLLKRRSFGIDINPSAYISAKAKTTPIEPNYLKEQVERFLCQIRPILQKETTSSVKPDIPEYERLDYWFTPTTKHDLGLLLALINELPDEKIRDFLYCGFSNILKNCSRWMMISVKPTIDKQKAIPPVCGAFVRHIKLMVKKNQEFWNMLPEEVREHPEQYVKVKLGDCRDIPVSGVRAIVTSSPYVTSYEYADVNQLTALWFRYASNVRALRGKFIGSAQNKGIDISLKSNIAKSIVEKFSSKGHDKVATEVATYFGEMQQAFAEFHRILQTDGIACFVIGNTSMKGIDILNAEVFLETCLNLGYKPVDVIKRRIPSVGKILPSIRDPYSGRFTSLSNGNGHKTAYSFEYIVIVKK